MERIEQRLGKKPRQMVADCGYTTRENIEKVTGREIDFVGSFSETGNLRPTAGTERLPASAFVDDRQRDVYVCPEGKLLGYDCRHTKGKGFAYYRYAKAAHASRSAVRRIKSEAVR